MTDPIDAELAAALVAAQLELTNVRKDKRAEAGKYGYTYADLGAVLELARPVLARHGLAVLQPLTTGAGHVTIDTLIVHSSGATYSCGTITANAPDSWQAFGSAVTYARRYALMSALALAGEDDDGAAATAGTSTGTVRTPAGLRGPAAAAYARDVSAACTPKQVAMIHRLLKAHGLTEAQLPDRVGITTPAAGLEQLTKHEASRLIDELSALPTGRPVLRGNLAEDYQMGELTGGFTPGIDYEVDDNGPVDELAEAYEESR